MASLARLNSLEALDFFENKSKFFRISLNPDREKRNLEILIFQSLSVEVGRWKESIFEVVSSPSHLLQTQIIIFRLWNSSRAPSLIKVEVSRSFQSSKFILSINGGAGSRNMFLRFEIIHQEIISSLHLKVFCPKHSEFWTNSKQPFLLGSHTQIQIGNFEN